MIIRNMTPEDVKQVAEIEAQCFSMPWSEKSFLDSINRSDTLFLVAAEPDSVTEGVDCIKEELKNRDKILGYIGMYVAFEEGEITNVAVAPECRKQGVGNALVTEIQLAGKVRNLDRLILEVRASNKSAISLYKKKNFTKLGVRKKFYEKPVEDAIIMAYSFY